jgi:hypothetical protein
MPPGRFLSAERLMVLWYIDALSGTVLVHYRCVTYNYWRPQYSTLWRPRRHDKPLHEHPLAFESKKTKWENLVLPTYLKKRIKKNSPQVRASSHGPSQVPVLKPFRFPGLTRLLDYEPPVILYPSRFPAQIVSSSVGIWPRSTHPGSSAETLPGSLA